ncbi:MAG: M23 family metallopeptidase [Bacteroidota bacterium]
MKNTLQFLILLSFLFSEKGGAQGALEIKFQPSEKIYVYETNGFGTPIDLYTAVIHNMAIVNHSNDSLMLSQVKIEAVTDQNISYAVTLGKTFLDRSAKRFKMLSDRGILKQFDAQFRTSQYLKGHDFSGDKTLRKGEATVITYRALLLQDLPDSLMVSVSANTVDGLGVTARKRIKVINHKSKNAYNFPLRGRWTVLGAPSLISHHRWVISQEFALDLVKVGANGQTFSGDGTQLEQFYAYGEPVFAIASGIVVETFDSAMESNADLKQPTETEEEAAKRNTIKQQNLLSKGFHHLLGNYVIIQHENGEYSYYAHLKPNSIKIKKGDSVTQGQQIGFVGNTGNSSEPHLHIHITDGDDMAYSRSLPVKFQNVVGGGNRHIHYGQILNVDD